MTQPSLRSLEHHDAFIERHIGPNDAEVAAMLRVVGHDSLEALTDAIVPASIKSTTPLALPGSMTEVEALAKDGGAHFGQLLDPAQAGGVAVSVHGVLPGR